jgi:Ubiquitin carboxyl-terminal hydrolase
VRGIRNNGNTCYANVILQSLASLPVFVESLESWRVIANEELAPVASELLRVLQSLRQRGETPALPWAADLSALLSLVRGSRLGQRFTAGDQHDALEFLQTLLALVEAAQVAAFRAPIGDFGPAALRLSLTIGSIGASRSPPLRRLPPPCPLSGLVSMQLVCKHCGFAKPTRHEEFTHLSLPLTSDLHSSLAALLGSEEVPEVECPQCSISTAVLRVKNRLDLATSLADMDGDDGDSCNVGRIESMRRVHTLLNSSCRQGETDTFCADVGDSAQLPLSLLDLNEPLIPERRPMLKSTALSRLPAVLCCHFVRMRGDGLKARGRVNFPLKLSFVSGPDGFSLLPEPRSRRNLVESQTQTQSQTQTPGTAVLRYALHAVIQHKGSDLAGHYTAFGLCLGNRLAAEWAHFNDHRWAYAKAEQVSGADDVSMLIYARF